MTAPSDLERDTRAIHGPTPPSGREVRDRVRYLEDDAEAAVAAVAAFEARDLQTIDATPAQLAEARAWAADCMWKEDPEDLADLTDRQVIGGVNRHYDGGWHELVRNAGLDERGDEDSES